MTATNHTVTGMLIAAVVPTPLAIPLAVGSHIVLDMLPHFGTTEPYRSRKFLAILGSDASIALSALVTVMVLQPTHWLLMVVSGVAAASPDLLWFRHWVAALRGRPVHLSKLDRWLSRIQWGERSYGLIYEALWCAAVVYLLQVALQYQG